MALLGGFSLAALLSVTTILVYFNFRNKAPERINLVLLGVGGAGHEGPDLTDTMIFVSLSPKGTTMVSIPRDLWYQPWQTKVNTLYYYGNKREEGGLIWTKNILSEILGQKLDYVVVVDFQVFRDLVDLVGGVDVLVEKTFDDYRYPIEGRENDLCDGDKTFSCRYERLHFEAGLKRMNGEEALKFARSRNAEGDEGTDTARSVRQQKIISALKEKLSSPQFYLSRQKIAALKEIFEKRVKGNVTQEGLKQMVWILTNPRSRQFESFVLDGWQEGENGIIYHPPKHASGQWVLLPRDDSWRGVHKFIGCLVSQESKSLCYPEQTPPTPVF